ERERDRVGDKEREEERRGVREREDEIDDGVGEPAGYEELAAAGRVRARAGRGREERLDDVMRAPKRREERRGDAGGVRLQDEINVARVREREQRDRAKCNPEP